MKNIFLFTLTTEHVSLVRNMYVGWEMNHTESTHPGAPAIKRFRTYGNTDLYGDLARLLHTSLDGKAPLNTKQKQEYLERVHRETELALQVILSSGSFQEGSYASFLPTFPPGLTVFLNQEQLDTLRNHSQQHPDRLQLFRVTVEKPSENSKLSISFLSK